MATGLPGHTSTCHIQVRTAPCSSGACAQVYMAAHLGRHLEALLGVSGADVRQMLVAPCTVPCCELASVARDALQAGSL